SGSSRARCATSRVPSCEPLALLLLRGERGLERRDRAFTIGVLLLELERRFELLDLPPLRLLRDVRDGEVLVPARRLSGGRCCSFRRALRLCFRPGRRLLLLGRRACTRRGAAVRLDICLVQHCLCT